MRRTKKRTRGRRRRRSKTERRRIRLEKGITTSSEAGGWKLVGVCVRRPLQGGAST